MNQVLSSVVCLVVVLEALTGMCTLTLPLPAEQFQVQSILDNDADGWARNRGDGVIRLWRNSANALEGVFTCRISGANPNTIHLVMYHPSKLYYICISSLHV